MADGDVALSVANAESVDLTASIGVDICDTGVDIPDESANQTHEANTQAERHDGELNTESNGDCVLEEPGRSSPSTVALAHCDDTGQNGIDCPLIQIENTKHSSQSAVIDSHSDSVVIDQQKESPEQGCVVTRHPVTSEVTSQETASSNSNTDSNISSEIDECIAIRPPELDPSPSGVTQSGCDSGVCEKVGNCDSSVDGPIKTLTTKGIDSTICEKVGNCDPDVDGPVETIKGVESTLSEVDSSLSNVSLGSHDSSSRAMTSASFTGSESGLEYESDSYDTGSTESGATTTRSDTSSGSVTCSVASSGSKSTAKSVEKVMRRLSESGIANSEALKEIHGAIRDTINATMNVLDSDPPSTSSNDSELAASPARLKRDTHLARTKETISDAAAKSLPQDIHDYSGTAMVPSVTCPESSDMKRYSDTDNNEELLSELSAELELVGQASSSDMVNGVVPRVVASMPEFKRLQSQLETIQGLCGKQQVQLDRQREEKEQGVANLELIYQAHIKELERTVSKQDAEIRHMKEKLTSHDAAAKKAVGALQEQLKLRVDQLTKMYRESSSEKDNMVMKYAQAEQRNIELVDRMTKMDAARREFLKEKELAVGRFRSVVTEKQRLHDMFEARSSDMVGLKRELERLRDQLSSHDVKVKWTENKLKAEVDAHKETKGKLEEFQKRLRQAKEETEQIRRNTQAMIMTYQDSEEIKSNSLDTQLKAKEELLLTLKLNNASGQEQNRIMKSELNSLRVKHSELLEELHTYKDKVQCQETERLVQEATLDKFRETLQTQKHSNHGMKERLQQLEDVEQRLLDAQSRLGDMKEQVTMLGESNTDFQTNMEACGIRESEHLEFTQKISEKNARVQSENITLSNALDSLREVHEKLQARSTELQDRVDQLERELGQEQEERKAENGSLATRLGVKEKQVAELRTQLEDETDENRTLKRRHTANTKDVMRQLQQTKRRLEAYEHRHGDHDSIGSNASSNGSLDHQPPGGSTRASSQEPIPPPKQEEPFVEVIEIDKQMLMEKIVRLQKSHARKNEKLDFMEDHIQRLIREVQKKARIIQSYVLREDAGSLSTASMDVNKSRKHREEMKVLVSRHGGVMASVFNRQSQDGALTLDLSLEINRKLLAVVEDVLLKNITLKENIDTLGGEIARLSQENRHLQLQQLQQGAPLVNSNA